MLRYDYVNKINDNDDEDYDVGDDDCNNVSFDNQIGFICYNDNDDDDNNYDYENRILMIMYDQDVINFDDGDNG